jgi:hypothetical protein
VVWRAPRAKTGPGTEEFGLSTGERLSPADVERRLPWIADPLQEPPTLSVERFAYVETTRAEITLPEKAGEYREFLDALERLHAAAGDIPLAVLLVPDEFQVEEAPWKDVEWVGIAARADRELPQKIVGAWLEQRRIPYVDLLRSCAPRPGSPTAAGTSTTRATRTGTHAGTGSRRGAGERALRRREARALSGGRGVSAARRRRSGSSP